MVKNPSKSHPSDDIIKETIDFWQKRNGVTMTEEEAREAIYNITGFFKVIAKWDSKERDKQKPK